MNKYIIPFTQFLLPHGEQRHTEIEVDEETFRAYEKVVARGFRMTIEILQNGMVSQCIENPEFGDFDCVVCANGPSVPVKLKEMLLRFDESRIDDWKDMVQ